VRSAPPPLDFAGRLRDDSRGRGPPRETAVADVDFDRFKRLASLDRDDVGSREEEVKINFVVPLLETLGHSRLRFEHKRKDILLREGLPPAAAVVVESKRYGEPLERHVEQLGRYALEERCFVGVLANGEEVRVYAPLWPGAPSFAETLVRVVRREALACPAEAMELWTLLSAEALTSGNSGRAVAVQQRRLAQLRRESEMILKGVRAEREKLQARLEAIAEQIAGIEREQEEVLARLDAAERGAAEAIRGLCGAAGSRPPEDLAGSGSRAPAAAKAERVGWTDDELCHKAGAYQRRILKAFVRAGTRRLPLKQVTKAIRLSPQQAWGALSAFTMPVKKGGKEPFLEVTRPVRKPRSESGAVVEILERHWERVVRLYGGGKS